MKSKYLLVGATTLLSSATATFASNAEAQTTRAGGTFSRSIGSGDITAKYEQYGSSSALLSGTGMGSNNDLWVTTKLFSKQTPLIHISSLAQSKLDLEGYGEYATAYNFVDGTTLVPPERYTCSTYDTCSNASTTLERALWNEKKSFAVLPGVTLTVTGSLNTKATFNAAARSYSGPASLGTGNHRIRAYSSLDAALDLNARLRGELDVLVASVALYGKVRMLGVSTSQAAKADGDRIFNGPGSFGKGSASASQTFLTGSGELGFEGSACLPCIAFPLTPIPIFTSFKQRITSWGNVYARTGGLWNQSYSY